MPGPRRYRCHVCREMLEPQESVRAIFLICYINTARFHDKCLRKLHATGRHPRKPSTRYAIVRIQDQEK